MDARPMENAPQRTGKDVMKGRYKYFATLLITAAALFSACGTRNEIKAPPVAADSAQATVARPDQQMKNARIMLYNKAVLTADIRADYIEKYEKQDSTLAWKLDVRFFDSSGALISTLVADSGLVREKTNFMAANGHVVAVNEDSSRLETEQLNWNSRTNLVETDKFVTIIQKGDTLTGYGLEADQRLKKIKIKKQVRGKLINTEGIEP
jgi:LPS export ABC transporter protein LptC